MTDEPETQWLDGEVRDYNEMSYALRIRGCPQCGSHDIGDPESNRYINAKDGREAGHYDITCPDCGHERRVAFYLADGFSQVKSTYPEDRVLDRHLGGPLPSRMISPHEFAAELARCNARIDSAFVGMFSDVFVDNRRRISSALSSVIELLKFVPAGADRVPAEAFRTPDARGYHAAHPEQFERAALDAELARWIALDQAGVAEMYRRGDLPKNAIENADKPSAPKPRMAQPLSSLSFKLHKQWLANKGGERLEATGLDATGKPFATLDLTSAVLTDVTLDRADLSFTRLHGAILTTVRARGAGFAHAMIAGTTLTDCDFTDAGMALANLGDATILRCRFTNANLERTAWYRSTLTGCNLAGSRLANAALDRAVFTDCDLRGATLALVTHGVLGTSKEAEFIRCDLRDTRWDGRDLFRVRFVGCKLAGAAGTPVLEATVIERPDLSPAGDGSQIGTARDVLRLWAIDPDARPPAPLPPTTRVMTYDLPQDEADAVMEELDRQRIGYDQRMFHRDGGLRFEISVREPLAESRKPMIDAIIAHYHASRVPRPPTPEQVRAEALNVATRKLQTVLDDAIDAGLDFEQTVAALVKHGLTREEALQAVISPGSIHGTLAFRS